MPDMDRQVALTKATELGIANNWGSESVALAAARFYEFLTEAEKKAATVEPRTSEFRLPGNRDGYTYFQFADSHILYRVRLSNPTLVERIASEFETGWSRCRNNLLGTFSGLVSAEGYQEVSTFKAARELWKNLQSKVRFV